MKKQYAKFVVIAAFLVFAAGAPAAVAASTDSFEAPEVAMEAKNLDLGTDRILLDIEREMDELNVIEVDETVVVIRKPRKSRSMLAQSDACTYRWRELVQGSGLVWTCE